MMKSKTLWFWPTLFAALFACADRAVTVSQAQLDQFAAQAKVHFTLLANHPDGACLGSSSHEPCFVVQLQISSAESIPAQGWAIYFSLVDKVIASDSAMFELQHINGDLHRLVAKNDKKTWQPNQTYSITFAANGAHLSAGKTMPNYYVAAEGRQARVIVSTQITFDRETELEQRPFADPISLDAAQFRQNPDDFTSPLSATDLYSQFQLSSSISEDAAPSLIPTPQKMQWQTRRVDLSQGIKLSALDFSRPALAAALARLASLGVAEKPNGITLSIKHKKLANPHRDAYQLDVTNDHIQIIANNETGAFYALQSLAALLRINHLSVPLLHIEDAPRYAFRGLHIDVARNFHSKALILKMLEQMSAYKLNVLHFHLADDEGWRLNIAGLPELTEVGAKRCHDLTEQHCLLPQLGSGPDESSAVNGFYTAEDYIEILRAASARHIQVIPSIDMPGHSRAAVKSMQARYQRLHAAGDDAKANEFLLSEADDRSQYESIQFYRDNTINVCLPSSYAFFEKVLSEFERLHAAAQHPLQRFHIGADETAGAWRDSPACQQLLREHGDKLRSSDDLGAYFVAQLGDILTRHGIAMAAWHDGLAKLDAQALPATVQSNVWALLSDDAHQIAHHHVNRQWNVVLSTPDALYFDFPYEADPLELGNHWAARKVGLRQVFEFMPDNLPAMATWWRNNGKAFALDDRAQKDQNGQWMHQPRQRGKTIVGIQAQLWSETLHSDRLVEWMAFPRVLGLAERAWHQASWELPYDYDGAHYDSTTTAIDQTKLQQSWAAFVHDLGCKELAKLEQADILYRLPLVGVRKLNGKLWANTEYPCVAIEYRLPSSAWQRYNAPLDLTDNIKIEWRTVAMNGVRKGRTVIFP